MSQRDGPRWVRASDLAQLAVCERLVLYEQRFGKQRTREQEEAAERGECAHDDFLRAALAVNPDAKTSIEAKLWCFVVSVAFAPDQLIKPQRSPYFGPVRWSTSGFSMRRFSRAPQKAKFGVQIGLQIDASRDGYDWFESILQLRWNVTQPNANSLIAAPDVEGSVCRGT